MQFIDECDGQYSVTNEAKEFLGNAHASTILIPVSIVGIYRSGKSTILNMICPSQPFPTSDNVKPQTLGLWMSKILYPIDKDKFILFIDSEGLGATSATESHDFNIFSLCILLCSKIIFNSKGALDTKSFHELQFAANIANLIKTNSEFKLGETSLLWVLRDFELKLKSNKNENEPISAAEYLEEKLHEMPLEFSESMKLLFQKRSCITVAPPNSRVVDIKNIKNLNPGFLNAIDLVKKDVFSTSVKEIGINKIPMNGSMLLSMALSFCEVLNSKNVVPQLQSTWDNLITTNTLQLNNILIKKTDYILSRIQKQPGFLTVFEDFTIKEWLSNGIVSFVYKSLLSQPTQEIVSNAIYCCFNHVSKYQLNYQDTFIKQDNLEDVDPDSFVLKLIEKGQAKSLKQLNDIKFEINELKEEVKVKENEINSLKLELSKVKTEVKDYNNSLQDTLKIELSNLQSKILIMEGEKMDLVLQVNNLNQTQIEFDEVSQTLTQSIESQRELLSKSRELNNKLAQDLEESQCKNKQQELQLTQHKSTIDELHKEQHQSKHKLESLHSEIKNDRERHLFEEERSLKRQKTSDELLTKQSIQLSELDAITKQRMNDQQKIQDLSNQIFTLQRSNNLKKILDKVI